MLTNSDFQGEVANLVTIGKIRFTAPHKNKIFVSINKVRIELILTSAYQHLLEKISKVYLIYTDHRVRYGKIDILKVINEKQAVINILDKDLKDEAINEKSIKIAIDEEEINKIDETAIYFDPIGMRVFWESKDIGQIKDFFYNGAHYVYEIKLEDARLVLVPDVDAFIEETNIENRFIKLKEFEQFLED
ncbi:MAG: hypothetical protein FWG98_08985 [Candidatus Cloacimonetes bacterium]|nr:hypothetical protein [Candidatus Cloacimonadota bacterium]